MDNKININCGGIKCDNPECDFIDMTVEMDEYDNWVNKSCPKCGCILLTEQDYKNIKFLQKFVNIVNNSLIDVPTTGETATVEVKMDGTGKMEFEMEDEKNNLRNFKIID